MGDEISDAPCEAARERLIADLNFLRQEVGRPSLGRLVSLSDHKFSKTALDEQLSGKRSNIPSWQFVAAYIRACHAAASETGLEANRLGSIDEWLQYWKAIEQGNLAVGNPIRVAAQVMDRRGIRHLSNLESSHQTRIPPIAADEATTSALAIMTMPTLPRLERISNRTGVLVIRNGTGSGKQFELKRDLITIGRAADNQVRLEDDSVSRQHAVINRQGARFMIRDVGSLNGTYVNQKLINSETPLGSYQELRIGAVRLLFAQGKRRYKTAIEDQ